MRNAWSAAFGETIPGDVLFFYISTHGGAAANNQSCTWLQTWETKAKGCGKGTGYESAIMREDIKGFDVEIPKRLSKVSSKLIRKVKLKTPVDTGVLRRSWHSEKDGDLTRVVYNNIKYALMWGM